MRIFGGLRLIAMSVSILFYNEEECDNNILINWKKKLFCHKAHCDRALFTCMMFHWLLWQNSAFLAKIRCCRVAMFVKIVFVNSWKVFFFDLYHVHSAANLSQTVAIPHEK